MTSKNPLQVLIDALANCGVREDSTRIGSGGTVRRQAVDVSPMRRVNQAIYLICNGARTSTFRNIKSVSESLADEIINASKVRYLFKYYRELTTHSQSERRKKSRESPRVTDELLH